MDILLDTNIGKIEIEMNATTPDYLHVRNMAIYVIRMPTIL